MVCAVLLRQPNLLNMATDALASKVEQMCVMLALPQPRVAQWLVDTPVLLTMSPGVLQSNFDHLQGVLDVGTRALAAKLLQHPHLLLFSSELVDTQLAELALVTQLPQEAVAAMVLQHPLTLKAKPTVWQDNMQSLEHTAGLGLAAAQGLVQARPGLLAWQVPVLQQACAELGALLAGSEAWMEQAHALDSEELGEVLRVMLSPDRLPMMQYVGQAGKQVGSRHLLQLAHGAASR
jgi:hypothetical protein